MDIVPGAGSAGDTSTVYYMVKKVAAVTGQDLRNARASVDENNRPAVSFTLSNEGGRKFGKVSGENIGRQLAIILDGRVQSAPTLESKINAEGRITGSFTPEEVQNLSLILRSGALPAKLDYLVGADHRPDARRRLDPLRHRSLGGRPRPRHRRSCWSTTRRRASTRWSR